MSNRSDNRDVEDTRSNAATFTNYVRRLGQYCLSNQEAEEVDVALHRDAEIDANPNQAISLAELDSQIHGRRA